MLLITCPVTRTDELVADRHIPCGRVHVYRTGRRWEQARTRIADRAATQSAVDAAAVAARAARVSVPA
jgi:hypothetical protein